MHFRAWLHARVAWPQFGALDARVARSENQVLLVSPRVFELLLRCVRDRSGGVAAVARCYNLCLGGGALRSQQRGRRAIHNVLVLNTRNL